MLSVGMLRSVAGLETGASLDDVDLQFAAEAYLTRHGMAEETIKALEAKILP